MKEKYYFAVNNQKTGPFVENEIEQRIRDGVITRDTLCWCSGMDAWKPVGDSRELLDRFAAPLIKQAVPPPLPTSVSTEPPELPKNVRGASAVDAGQEPSGLSPFEASCYRIALLCFPAIGKWQPPLRKWIVKNPKNAVSAVVGTGCVVALIGVMAMSNGKQGQKESGPQQGAMGVMNPGGFNSAQYQAIRSAQQFGDNVLDETYKYRRDSQDRMDDSYRRATYDWYKKDND
jgi:hypothetical protein